MMTVHGRLTAIGIAKADVVAAAKGWRAFCRSWTAADGNCGTCIEGPDHAQGGKLRFLCRALKKLEDLEGRKA